MRSGLLLGLALMILVAGAAFARAEEAETCPVPASLLATESSLPKVAEAVNSGRPLDILVIGSFFVPRDSQTIFPTVNALSLARGGRPDMPDFNYTLF